MTPPDTTIYLHPSAQGPIYTFVFYAEQPLREATLKQLNTDPDIRYALVEKSVAEKLHRPHERIGTMTAWKTPLVLVKFTEVRPTADTGNILSATGSPASIKRADNSFAAL